MIKEIRIPDISENVETGLIANILVSEGDEVSVDQALVEVETDKATTDIPSDYNGVVKEIKVKEGEEVKVNQVIIILEVKDDKDDSKEDGKKKESGDTTSENSDTDNEDNEDTDKKDRDTDNEEDLREKENNKEEKEDTNEQDEDESRNDKQIPTSPLARKTAREHNVDLSKVKATGPGSRISREDVENYINENKKVSQQNESKSKSITSGDSSTEPLNNIGRITAETMQEAWQNIPHVTQFDEANITELENFRKEHGSKIEKQGGKLTITAILLKIATFALQKFPRFNSSLDWENQEIIYKHFYNLGVAVDTPQGLLVPVIRDVNRKSLAELSIELTEIASKARDKKLSPDEMKGGTFTVSNLGGIGGTGFAPIVYPPQVAILGISRAEYQQIFIKDKDEFQKHLIIPVSLSYDHRVINGADGARFLKYICDVMENPYALLF